MSHIKIADVKAKGKDDLLKAVKDAKEELLKLRVQKAANNAAASKVAKIRVLRKNVARILTVLSQKNREAIRTTLANKNPKRMPKSLRPKLTHRRRLALSRAEKAFKTQRAIKKSTRFPQRQFAVKL